MKEESNLPFDLFDLYTKNISEMSDEELRTNIVKLREMRMKRHTTKTKKKSMLDLIIGKLSEKNAAAILNKLSTEKEKEK